MMRVHCTGGYNEFVLILTDFVLLFCNLIVMRSIYKTGNNQNYPKQSLEHKPDKTNGFSRTVL